jgi:hypothetical protein
MDGLNNNNYILHTVHTLENDASSSVYHSAFSACGRCIEINTFGAIGRPIIFFFWGRQINTSRLHRYIVLHSIAIIYPSVLLITNNE